MQPDEEQPPSPGSTGQPDQPIPPQPGYMPYPVYPPLGYPSPGSPPPGYAPPPGAPPPGYGYPPAYGYYYPPAVPQLIPIYVPPAQYHIPATGGNPPAFVAPAQGSLFRAWRSLAMNLSRQNYAAWAQAARPGWVRTSIIVALLFPILYAATAITLALTSSFTSNIFTFSGTFSFGATRSLQGFVIVAYAATPVLDALTFFAIPFGQAVFMSSALGTVGQRYRRALKPWALSLVPVQLSLLILDLLSGLVSWGIQHDTSLKQNALGYSLIVFTVAAVFSVTGVIYTFAQQIQSGAIGAAMNRWAVFGVNLLTSFVIGIALDIILVPVLIATALSSLPRITITSPTEGGLYGPSELRQAYHVDSLIQQGYTGAGQTIIDMVCFGNSQVQSDLDAYSQYYGLPHTTVQVVAPLGPNAQPQSSADQMFQEGWAGETSLDVEMYHALAPNANIVVLVAPVCEPEGIVGLPQAREELQYALDHHLGDIISISGGTSELTLTDPASRAELKLWDPILQRATTQDGVTIFVSSGDNGSTDYRDLEATQLSTQPTTSFPTDSPWVTSVGGTSLDDASNGFSETAWSDSGGGFSRFYSEPAYQETLPSADQSLLQSWRGVPDVAADADPNTGVRVYISGQWYSGYGGTSIAAPIWAGVMAIADQMAGRPLGFINPALYQIGESSKGNVDFNDITSGNNTQTVGNVTVPGYAATPGWDPVTGWGTPDASKLIPDLIADIAG
jgi:subtilase family serine protease